MSRRRPGGESARVSEWAQGAKLEGPTEALTSMMARESGHAKRERLERTQKKPVEV
jgi:hypothetical protein